MGPAWSAPRALRPAGIHALACASRLPAPQTVLAYHACMRACVCTSPHRWTDGCMHACRGVFGRQRACECVLRCTHARRARLSAPEDGFDGCVQVLIRCSKFLVELLRGLAWPDLLAPPDEPGTAALARTRPALELPAHQRKEASPSSLQHRRCSAACSSNCSTGNGITLILPTCCLTIKPGQHCQAALPLHERALLRM